MSKLELQLSNGGMQLNIIAVIGNKALLKRLNDDSFIVVDGLQIHNDFTCEWDFARDYCEDYDTAYLLFIDKVVKPFMEYQEVFKTAEV